ncbi:MAG TPA: asparagine synthase (glutamine-hydrolyzing) [Verrucomicrobiae bacterium]|nr:asparagine synthase (glutamine-hydrolyzing) [Verrucomicrobiae bacterium]
MCGICGTVGISTLLKPEANRNRVAAMLRSMAHRGPDDAGYTATSSAVLGVTRLAIRGLSDANQPIVDPGSGVTVVCNGEIDNHRELRRWLAERGRPVSRKTDVAILPDLYLELGDAFVERLAGAFAIAVWDPRRPCLVLARDRAGERPLFFRARGREIMFATELAALAAQPRLKVKLNRTAFRSYLQFGIFPSPVTPFAEIQKVAPGELIHFDATGIQRRFYWRWRIAETLKRTPSLDLFDKTFRAAVARQTDVEVDFGIFLSGGIDSSLVGAVARSLHPKRSLKAYTLRFQEESYDEGNFAETVARQLKMDLVPVWVKPGDVRDGLRSLVRLVGEPLADPAWIPAALLARRAAEDVKLALVGEGADELFGGYPTYPGAGVADRLARLPGPLRWIIRRAVEALPPSDKKVTISFLLKRFVAGMELDGLARHQSWISNIAPPLLQRLTGERAEPVSPGPKGDCLLDQLQQWDLEHTLAEGLLTKADRSSMSSSLELRAPFLDQAVMEFARFLSPEDRVRRFQTKVFLKRYALRYLPEKVVHRRKRGLSVPIGAWIRGPLSEWAEAALCNPHFDRIGLRAGVARELFAEHVSGQADHARALWTLIVLSEWLDWMAASTTCDNSIKSNGTPSDTTSGGRRISPARPVCKAPSR